MNKRNTSIVIIIVILTLFGYAILNYKLSFKKAYFAIKPSGVSVTIYDSNKRPVGSLPGSGTLSLRMGKYTAVPSGNNTATTPLPFNVTDSGSYLPVDPGYSDTYLGGLLATESPAITAVITAAYPTIMQNFTISKGSLYLYGDWYATTLIQHSLGRGQNGDTYRTVLQKHNGVWIIVAPPAITLSRASNTSIPVSILNSINSATGY